MVLELRPADLEEVKRALGSYVKQGQNVKITQHVDRKIKAASRWPLPTSSSTARSSRWRKPWLKPSDPVRLEIKHPHLR
jgi:hypothetical protein